MKAMEYFWLALTVFAAIVTVSGAWWHLLSAGISLSMYLMIKADNAKEEEA